MAMTTARNPRQPQRPASHASTFDCIICMEENLPSSSGFMPGMNRYCKHCSSICRHCVTSYINASVEQGKSFVKCPVPECDWTFDPISCRELVAREIFDRWCDLLCELAVRDYEWCYCPNLDCQEPIIDECRATPQKQIRCPGCGKSCCFRCSAPWDERHKCDDVYGVIKTKQWKRCPGCKYYVERTGGCTTILCRCQTQFCYYCGAKGDRHNCSCSKGSRDWENVGIMFLKAAFVIINLCSLCKLIP